MTPVGSPCSHFPNSFSTVSDLGAAHCDPHLACINATLRIASTEHLGFDLIPVEVRAVANFVAYDGNPGLLEHHSLLA